MTGSTSIDDVTLFRVCKRHDIDYTVAIPEGTTFWRLRVEVVDPQGLTSQGNVVNADTSSGTGTFRVQFCGSETPGTWIVRATGFTQTVPLLEIPFALPDTAFQVRSAATRTTLAKERIGASRYLMTVKVREQGPHGAIRPDSTRVNLQRRVEGTWQVVPGGRLMTYNGVVTKKLALAPGTKLRAVTLGAGNFGGSVSRPVRVG